MNSRKAFTACALIILAISVAAQNSLDSLLPLKEVTVVGERYREVIPSQRLSGERLEALNSFSVADAIRYFSGVQIKDYGGIGGLKTVDIRSMGTNHMGVFYDGIELGNAQNGQVDLGKFSLDNIEEISLYNGQKSEIFQSAKDFGSSGSVYLRTRRPKFYENKKFNVRSFIRGGSFDLINPSVLWEQKICNNVASSVNIEFLDASGKYKFRYRRVLSDGSTAWDTTAVRENGDLRAIRVEGGLNGYIEGGKWDAKAYFYDSDRGIPGAIVNNVWKHYERQSDRNFFTQGSFQKKLSDSYDFLANVKYANDRMHYINPDSTLMYINNTFLQQELYVSVANKYSLTGNWDISLSSDYQYNILDASLRDFIYPKRHTFLLSSATAFEYWRIKAQGSVLGTFVFEDVKKIERYSDDELLPGVQRGTPDDKREITPAVFVSYKPFHCKDFNLRAFYKHIFRMPTFNDLYYPEIGYIHLEPEYTIQYNLGFMYDKEIKYGRKFSRFLVKVDAYYNEVDNKIVAVPGKSGGLYRWMMINFGYVEIRGIDVNVRTTFNPFPDGVFNFNLSYTYQRAQDFTYSDEEISYGGQLPYIPWHNGSVILNGIYRWWDINYSFLYSGERYHYSANIPINYERPWYTHDMSVGKKFCFGKFNCKVTAEINNLLDQQYDVVLNYPMPGRNYKIILKTEI
ncbi:MAG: TonB-dependent receptor plug domain-containing protein [Dysgonamonadaceae bacterium]|jgi:outer membrane cobalamin receptor|nr:TonB-dependent receptor plug domain-containing protein [Dysgonamonadaceae bacterium]